MKRITKMTAAAIALAIPLATALAAVAEAAPKFH